MHWVCADGSYGDGWNGVSGPVRGLLFGDPAQLAAQVMGVAANAGLVFGLSYAFFTGIERLIANRVTSKVEWNGLDGLEMGSEAYPRE
jgi:ammonium transporter, Amt family